jgi:hypothetical protein
MTLFGGELTVLFRILTDAEEDPNNIAPLRFERTTENDSVLSEYESRLTSTVNVFWFSPGANRRVPSAVIKSQREEAKGPLAAHEAGAFVSEVA